MRSFLVLAFDDFIHGSSSVYTAEQFNELLASADQLALFAVADSVGTASLRLHVRLEHSSDQRNWENRSTSANPEINDISIPQNTTTWTSGYDTGSTPSQAFMRAKIYFNVSGSAHVKLSITGRSKSAPNGGASRPDIGPATSPAMSAPPANVMRPTLAIPPPRTPR
jgi:hypothetical protein